MAVKHNHHELNIQLIVLLSLFFLVLSIGIATANLGFSLDSLTRAQTPFQGQTTIDFSAGLRPLGELPKAGIPNPGDDFYCLEDEDKSGCEAGTGFKITKGTTGKSGECGTIISQAHTLAPSLQRKTSKLLDSLNYTVKNCNYETGVYNENYLATHLIIDSYNLAGFDELSKENSNHTLGKNLLDWWKSPPPGYKFLPYSTNNIYQYAYGQQDLTGCVLFTNYPSGVHTALVNSFQLVNQNGDGVLSVLQAGTTQFIARYEIIGWKIKNQTLNGKEPVVVAGFGCKE